MTGVAGRTFQERFRRRLRYYRDSGAPATAVPLFVLDSLDKLGVRINPYLLVVENVTGAPPPAEPASARYEYRFLEATDMPGMASIDDHGVAVAPLLARLNEGQLCYGALCDSSVVSFSWCNLTECVMGSTCLRKLRPDEAYLFDAFTVEDSRGRGLAPYIRHRLYRELGGRGRTRMYSVTKVVNAPAMAFKKTLGARRVESGCHVRLFGRGEFVLRFRRYDDWSRP